MSSPSTSGATAELSQRSSKNDLNGEEPDINTEVLFSGDEAVLTQFSAFRFKDFDNPPPESKRIKEGLVATGTLQVYKMLGKERASFLRCGSFVQPILPKLRVWRTRLNEFVLPQPLPEKYWKIELPLSDENRANYEVYMELEMILQQTCFYRNLVPPPAPPSASEELSSPYSSSASTLDQILDKFQDSDTTSLEYDDSDTNNNDNDTSPYGPEVGNRNMVFVEHDDDFDDHPESLTSASTATSGSSEATKRASESTAVRDYSDSNSSDPIEPSLAPASGYMRYHPLVPLATRNNIISSTVPLKFRPMDDDWLEVSGSQIPSYSYPATAAPSVYLSWASQVTGDLVSGSSNYLSDKMDKMTLYSTSYIPRLTASHPQSHWSRAHPRSSYIDEEHRQLVRFPDFYHQAVTVSGYMGWKLWNRVWGGGDKKAAH